MVASLVVECRRAGQNKIPCLWLNPMSVCLSHSTGLFKIYKACSLFSWPSNIRQGNEPTLWLTLAVRTPRQKLPATETRNLYAMSGEKSKRIKKSVTAIVAHWVGEKLVFY
ncbi:hypothetical protein PoB_007472500 [Plakobranchus ocellatus]|uniref:Uncharacterized protein n=1 Tax=Plakobranchus ocellatus TaxID=259542 RepID=A0AAV4DVN4_9GAST|nr:hypothetical protein PoB_007472500 [Plakobranchus ocellatus]